MKHLLFTLFFALTALTACSDDDTPQYNIPIPSGSAGFTWKENDPNGADIAAASATFSTQYKTLMAKDAQGSLLFEINLEGDAAGTYTIGGGNAVTYVGITPFFVAESGEVILTSNANGKVSGTFKAFRTGNGLTRIYGKFTDITVIP